VGWYWSGRRLFFGVVTAGKQSDERHSKRQAFTPLSEEGGHVRADPVEQRSASKGTQCTGNAKGLIGNRAITRQARSGSEHRHMRLIPGDFYKPGTYLALKASADNWPVICFV
jgi:hypothetical protein